MSTNPLAGVTTLTFDMFGTVLDLAGSLVPPTGRFLAARSAPLDGEAFWKLWRARQRIEQFQDTLMMLGHSGYLETCRRAFVYCLKASGVTFEDDTFMEAWQDLTPFDDAALGLERLRGRYRLVALSNGEQWYLEHLVKDRIGFDFDDISSVERAGAFKPHPSVYRTAARLLGAAPAEIMMVASHSFDVMGARACGYRGAYVNRYRLPFDETQYRPDIEVNDFVELAARLP